MITDYPYFTFKRETGGRIKDFSLLDGDFAFEGLLTIHKTAAELADFLYIHPDHQILTPSDVFRIGYGDVFKAGAAADVAAEYRERYLKNINDARRLVSSDPVTIKRSAIKNIELINYEAVWLNDDPNLIDLIQHFDAYFFLSISSVNFSLFRISFTDMLEPPYFLGLYSVTPERSILRTAEPRSLITYSAVSRADSDDGVNTQVKALLDHPVTKRICAYYANYNNAQLSRFIDESGNALFDSDKIDEINQAISDYQIKAKNHRVELFNSFNTDALNVFISSTDGPVMTRERADGGIDRLMWGDFIKAVMTDGDIYLALIPSGDITWKIHNVQDFMKLADMPRYLTSVIKLRFYEGITDADKTFITEMINEEIYYINQKSPGVIDIKSTQKSLFAGDLQSIEMRIIVSAARGAKKIEKGVV